MYYRKLGRFMDKFDRLITEILRSNARASVSEIARAVSLSRTAVTARIQKLEKLIIHLTYQKDIDIDLNSIMILKQFLKKQA